MEQARRVREAKWRICALLVREYKNNKQRDMLDKRKELRGDRVCSRTINVGRLTPKGGVVYREGRVNTARIKDTEMYKTHRWPRRDKTGPTLAGILHDLWEIT